MEEKEKNSSDNPENWEVDENGYYKLHEFDPDQEIELKKLLNIPLDKDEIERERKKGVSLPRISFENVNDEVDNEDQYCPDCQQSPCMCSHKEDY